MVAKAHIEPLPQHSHSKVALRPSQWARQALWLSERDRLSFRGRAYVPEMIDTRATEVVWMTSRQIGKTVNSLALHAFLMANIPDYKVIYVVPEMDQAAKYSHDRVEPMMMYSPLLSELHTGLDNVFEKGFGNGSRIYMKWVKHGVTSTRGITGHFLHADESQDIPLREVLPVIKQMLFTAKKHAYFLYSGTPLSHDNELSAEYWAKSDRREWMVRCRHHSPAKLIELGPRNLGKKGPICHHCGNLVDVDDGCWVAASPSPPGIPLWERKMPGFHVAQIHCKDSHHTEERWHRWLRDLEKTPEDRALNEIWGRSSSTSSNPITRELMVRLCGSRVMLTSPCNDDFVANRYAGIDWGHGESATTLLIGQVLGGKFHVLFMQMWEGSRTDADVCVPEILQALETWKVNRVHCDFGGGHGTNKPLALRYGRERVTTNLWSANASDRDRIWRRKGLIVPRLTLNKTRVLSELLVEMKAGGIIFPELSCVEPFMEFFTNVRQERNRDDKLVFIKKKRDDMFHALAYAWIISGSNASGQLDDGDVDTDSLDLGLGLV